MVYTKVFSTFDLYENSFYEENSLYRSSNKIVDVLLVVDTQQIIDNVRDISENAEEPKKISNESLYLISSDEENSKIEKILKKAVVGDIYRFHVISESANFDHSVILVNVKSDLFSHCRNQISQKMIMEPGIVQPLPAGLSDKKINYYSCFTNKIGNGTVNINFVLYKRNNGVQNLYSFLETEILVSVPY